METFSALLALYEGIHWWIPLTNASDAELCCILWSAPEQTAEQTIETPVIWDAIVPIMTSLYCLLFQVKEVPQEEEFSDRYQVDHETVLLSSREHFVCF